LEEINLLKQEIHKVFPQTEPPSGNIAPHPCEECTSIRKAFQDEKWWNFSPGLVEDMYDKLSLFTPEAYHYYFPGYLLAGLDDFVPYSDINEFIIYSWRVNETADYFESYKERRGLFSPAQIEVVKKYLQMVLENDQMNLEHGDAKKALTLLNKTIPAD
jgi:uncharacterized protein DUF6714